MTLASFGLKVGPISAILENVIGAMLAAKGALETEFEHLPPCATRDRPRHTHPRRQRRLMTIPGIGPITATALLALAQPAESVRKGRDFAAWPGLTPLQRSTGGKQRLAATSRMGERTLRRLLIIGSSAIVLDAANRGAPRGSWLEQMMARKPRMLVTVALANKTARIAWALLAREEVYWAQPVAVKNRSGHEGVGALAMQRRVWQHSRRDGTGS